jgi:hypothetical protein
MPKNTITDQNLIRDQVLTRLWQLANLSHEVTRGSIAGQIKAVSLIIAIEGLIPGRPSPSATRPTASPVEAEIYAAEWLQKQQHQAPDPHAADKDPGETVAPEEAQPGTGQVIHPEPTPPVDQNHPSPAKSLIPEEIMRVPGAAGGFVADTRLPFSIQKGRFGWRR